MMSTTIGIDHTTTIMRPRMHTLSNPVWSLCNPPGGIQSQGRFGLRVQGLGWHSWSVRLVPLLNTSPLHHTLAQLQRIWAQDVCSSSVELSKAYSHRL